MTTKTFCDGCDDEIESFSRKTTVVVTYEPPAGAVVKAAERFDLCESCLNDFNGKSLPKRWPRIREAAAA